MNEGGNYPNSTELNIVDRNSESIRLSTFDKYKTLVRINTSLYSQDGFKAERVESERDRMMEEYSTQPDKAGHIRTFELLQNITAARLKRKFNLGLEDLMTSTVEPFGEEKYQQEKRAWEQDFDDSSLEDRLHVIEELDSQLEQRVQDALPYFLDLYAETLEVKERTQEQIDKEIDDLVGDFKELSGNQLRRKFSNFVSMIRETLTQKLANDINLAKEEEMEGIDTDEYFQRFWTEGRLPLIDALEIVRELNTEVLSQLERDPLYD